MKITSTKELHAIAENTTIETPNGKSFVWVKWQPAEQKENGTRIQGYNILSIDGKEVKITSKQLCEEYGVEKSGSSGDRTRKSPQEKFEEALNLLENLGILSEKVQELKKSFGNLRKIEELKNEKENLQKRAEIYKEDGVPVPEKIKKRLSEIEKELKTL